jgi:hypothetical protein
MPAQLRERLAFALLPSLAVSVEVMLLLELAVL